MRKIPSASHSAAIFSESNAMCPPIWTSIAAFGLCSETFRSKSSNDMQRSSLLQSTNRGLPPACWIASGEAMKVFDGQRTFSPSTSAYRSAASAPPDQPPNATAGRPLWAPQASSNAAVSRPSDHWFESITESQSWWSRARSRSSNPIANLEKSAALSPAPGR